MGYACKVKKVKEFKGTLAWLFSPFTESVKHLLRYAGYLPADQTDQSNLIIRAS